MRDDISAELLATASLYDAAGIDGANGADMCRAAADEIERLRAKVAVSEDGLTAAWMAGAQSYHSDIRRLRAEQDALRAEVGRLSETVQDLVSTYSWYAEDREDRKPVMDGAVDDARETLALEASARAALEGKG